MTRIEWERLRAHEGKLVEVDVERAPVGGVEAAASAIAQTPVGTAFTYSGRLTQGGAAANGSFDFEFSLHDAESAGDQIGATIARSGVTVTGGLFLADLDFGPAAFSSSAEARWLEIGTRAAGSLDPFTVLVPRQRIAPAPFSIHAETADRAREAETVTSSVPAAQIVRDFIDAYVLAGEVARGLASGGLEFSSVEGLVGDAEDSVLYRLKEGCHALFRSDQDRPADELAAEELFDLAVGALFHEAMKFREGFYVTRSYGPRLERMRAADGASPLLDAFHGVLESGRRRVDESAAELQSLLRETREQLLILLRQRGTSGAVVRALVEDPERSEQVFGLGIRELLAEIYGDAERAYRLSLRMRPEGNLAHAGLALLLASTGRDAEAGREAKTALEVLDSYARDASARTPSTEDISPFKSPTSLREALTRLLAPAEGRGG